MTWEFTKRNVLWNGVAAPEPLVAVMGLYVCLFLNVASDVLCYFPTAEVKNTFQALTLQMFVYVSLSLSSAVRQPRLPACQAADARTTSCCGGHTPGLLPAPWCPSTASEAGPAYMQTHRQTAGGSAARLPRMFVKQPRLQKQFYHPFTFQTAMLTVRLLFIYFFFN